MGRVPVWVDVMESPFGSSTVMGFLARCTLPRAGLLIVKKCPVLPVSAMEIVVVGGSMFLVG